MNVIERANDVGTAEEVFSPQSVRFCVQCVFEERVFGCQGHIKKPDEIYYSWICRGPKYAQLMAFEACPKCDQQLIDHVDWDSGQWRCPRLRTQQEIV